MTATAITPENLMKMQIGEIIKEYPFSEKFFSDNGIEPEKHSSVSISTWFSSLPANSDYFTDGNSFSLQLAEYIAEMEEFLGIGKGTVESVTILPGRDKSGRKENFERIIIKKNEIVSIVGPTGSGKSRLLGDIEWAAQGDTPTGRTILVNEKVPDKTWRYSSSEKLVAQLSQNMNFVMDLSVYEFLELHAESRMITDRETVISRVIAEANRLAGEKFTPETAVTALSGGQSRALMIADTAVLSRSPIILIDEIENAGIDRKKALELLLAEGKIVLMATHDPVLALLGGTRLVIKNGGISKVIKTTEKEKTILTEVEALDRRIQFLRQKLRNGEILTEENRKGE